MDTSPSLLDRLHRQPDPADWRRWHDLYTPLIRNWLRGLGLRAGDVDDLVQEVLAVVVRKLPDFRHNDRKGAFRKWLRTITVYCLRDHLRADRLAPMVADASMLEARLDQLADEQSAVSREWDRQHDLMVMQKLLEQIQPAFEPTTWQAFEQFALHGHPAAEVATNLGISTNAVFIAKSRVLQRLRAEAAGILD